MNKLLMNPQQKLLHLLDRPLTMILGAVGIVLVPALAFASQGQGVPAIFGIRGEFILFALTLIGVAIFHKKTMYVALIGLASILIFKLLSITGFSLFNHLFGHGH